MSSITVCVDEVFHNYSPRELNCSVAEVGNGAGEWSWNNAKDAAHYHLLQGPYSHPADLTTITALCELIQQWAADTDAWDEDERSKWTTIDCLALFLQNVAADMREAGVDSTCLSDAPFDQAFCDNINIQNTEQRGGFWYSIDHEGDKSLRVEWSAS